MIDSRMYKIDIEHQLSAEPGYEVINFSPYRPDTQPTRVLFSKTLKVWETDKM
jgi:hypothetical protein